MLVQWGFSNTFCKILKIQTVCLLLGEYMFFQEKKKNLKSYSCYRDIWFSFSFMHV